MIEADYNYENWIKDDYRYMNEIMPSATYKLRRSINEECDKLEYHGSIMYDRYPDKEMLHKICKRIIENNNARPDIEPYVYSCLAYEMMLRRRRRCRRCGWMPD